MNLNDDLKRKMALLEARLAPQTIPSIVTPPKTEEIMRTDEIPTTNFKLEPAHLLSFENEQSQPIPVSQDSKDKLSPQKPSMTKRNSDGNMTKSSSNKSNVKRKSHSSVTKSPSKNNAIVNLEQEEDSESNNTSSLPPSDQIPSLSDARDREVHARKGSFSSSTSSSPLVKMMRFDTSKPLPSPLTPSPLTEDENHDSRASLPAPAPSSQSPPEPKSNQRKILSYFQSSHPHPPSPSPVPSYPSPQHTENITPPFSAPLPAPSNSSLPTPLSPLSKSNQSSLSSSLPSLPLSSPTLSPPAPSPSLPPHSEASRKQMEALRTVKEQAEAKANRLEAEIKGHLERARQQEERISRLTGYLESVSREMALQEGRRKRDRMALDCVRLGKIITGRTGHNMTEIWEEGYGLKALNKKQSEHTQRKEELERRKKRLAAEKRQQTKREKGGAGGGGGRAGGEEGEEDDCSLFLSEYELMVETEALKTHSDQIKREEVALAEERRMLDAEKAAHLKEIRRLMGEDRSRFSQDPPLPLLHSRYLLLSLIGKGGFSEVWRALDTRELREVAIKVHQLHSNWSEERKTNYIKHVTREFTIHRDMSHPRVVRFFDVFEIDLNSFATVLELCKGTEMGLDLDERLKVSRSLSEKEAKSILLQVLSGLVYLNTPAPLPSPSSSSPSESGSEDDPLSNHRPSPAPLPASLAPRRLAIIHYDLKPANILFDEMGDAKITDFGLSKIIMDSMEQDGVGVELTSQGAGTYWYLPPECFHRDETVRISSKVDVWSLGIIFYQMLYGKRPFGEGKTQDRVLSEGIMLHASGTHVDFPSDPKVTEDAKEFIRTCLAADQLHRPDVLSLVKHPYLKK